MAEGHWDVGKDHVQVGRRCSLGRRKRSERSHQGQAGRVATCDHEGFASTGVKSPPNLRCRATLENGVAGPFGPRTRVRGAYCGATGGGGPRPSGNRGANGGGAKSLVERLNQTVSIHLDTTDAPTHHDPGSHSSPLRVRRLGLPRSPPRPTENDPSRADLGGQW